MQIAFISTCKHTGLTHKNMVHNVAYWRDEAYPPGGMLRVMYNDKGQMVAGPLLSEMSEFREIL